MLDAFRAAVADPAQVRTRAVDRNAGAHDASHFLLIPQALVNALVASLFFSFPLPAGEEAR